MSSQRSKEIGGRSHPPATPKRFSAGEIQLAKRGELAAGRGPESSCPWQAPFAPRTACVAAPALEEPLVRVEKWDSEGGEGRRKVLAPRDLFGGGSCGGNGWARAEVRKGEKDGVRGDATKGR